MPAFAGSVYYHPGYYRALAANNEGEPTAALYHNKDCTIFYPFLLRRIPAILTEQEHFDIESGYGYGGPACFNADPETVTAFTSALSHWAANNDVVAEFIRFNPLTASHCFFENYCHPELNRSTLCIDLTGSPEEILAHCTPARRRNYHKARRAGLKVQIAHDFACFTQIYHQAMQQLNADEYYYFSADYFAALKKMAPEKCLIAVVTDHRAQPVAAAIFLVDNLALHYHLGGATPAGRAMQATSFCMLESAFHGARISKQLMHLGGGLSLDENDSLYRFKRGFTPIIKDFYIGKKIHKPELYATISQKWQQLTGAQSELLLHYHRIPTQRRKS